MIRGFKHNGVIVTVQKWDTHKHPVLAVQFENENKIYKVASFNSTETADWFADVMEQFFEGMVNNDQGN